MEVLSMSEEMNHELLKATAEESMKEAEKKRQEEQQNSTPDAEMPRPKFQRVLALVLACLVIIGVILSYYYIANS